MRLLLLVFLSVTVIRAATVTLNPATTYQTIKGYGGTSGTPKFVSPELRDEILDTWVNDLGINRLRIEARNGNQTGGWRSWEWENDNDDPDSINWSALNNGEALRRMMEDFVVPLKQRVEANGDTFYSYYSPSFYITGSTGDVPEWLLRSPGEYAENAISYMLCLKNTYGVEPTYCTILNEASYHNRFSIPIVQTMIKTLGPKLQAAGLATRIQFPESVSPLVAWNAIQQVQDDDEMWQYVAGLSYHLYNSRGLDPYRSYIRDFAVARGMYTAQTEFMGYTMNHLYADLTEGGTSFWEIYGVGSQLLMHQNKLERKSNFWPFRQVMHYVRPGAVRIDALSDDSNLRVLSFIKNGRNITVLINGTGSRTVTVKNITNGTYGVCQSVNAGRYQEQGIVTAAGDSVTVTIPANTVMTIYPYAGTNLAPVPTEWKAADDLLTMPASTTTLTSLATDPELDAVSYRWSVLSQPAGADAQLAAPTASSTGVSAMTVAGMYVFRVAISDAGHTVTRDVRVPLNAANMPPIVMEVHNRIPVTITLPQDSTVIRCAAWDPEGAAITYLWRVISKPAGSSPTIDDAASNNTALRNLSAAGDYLLEITFSDGHSAVRETLEIPVYPANANAPSITNAAASPSAIALPVDSTVLSATVTDANGDGITHWWTVKSKPAGAPNPVFSRQGRPITAVSNLAMAGTYVFTLTAADRTKYSTKDVTVTVTGSSAGTLKFSTAAYSVNEDGGSVQISVTRTGGSTGAVSVSYATSDGTAAAGSDYTAASGTLSWADGSTATRTFSVAVTDDAADESDETVTLTLSNATGGASLGSPSAATLTIADNDGTAPVPNLLCHYTFDNNVLDASGNGNDGTPVGGPSYTPGRHGQALQLNGTSQYVDGADIDFPSGPFSIAVWFNTTASPAGPLLHKITAGTNQNYYIYPVTANGAFCGLYDGSGWQEATSGASVTFNDGAWHQLVMVVDASNVTIFVDTVGYAAVAHDNSFPTNNADFLVGKQNNAANYYTGAVDELRIYDQALNAAEIAQLYHDDTDLPVTLTSFTAVADDRDIVLEWNTAAEERSMGFNVLRSGAADGSFTTVNGSLIPGAGTTTVPQSYQYTDTDPGAGTWYYKLEQVDSSGIRDTTDAVSATIMVSGIGLYPQPGDAPFRLQAGQTAYVLSGQPAGAQVGGRTGLYLVRQADGSFRKVLVIGSGAMAK